MDRNEEIRLSVVGDLRALFERYEGVILARINHLRTWKLLLDHAAKAQCDIEAEILLEQAVRADRASIVATMAGIDHDAMNFQAKSARERGIAAAHLFRCGWNDRGRRNEAGR